MPIISMSEKVCSICSIRPRLLPSWWGMNTRPSSICSGPTTGGVSRIMASAELVPFTPKMRTVPDDLWQLWKNHPVSMVEWVHIDQIRSNDYNPNSVARTEMQLLATSIRHDGYTQPIVTV